MVAIQVTFINKTKKILVEMKSSGVGFIVREEGKQSVMFIYASTIKRMKVITPEIKPKSLWLSHT
jgi:hypothetical protein